MSSPRGDSGGCLHLLGPARASPLADQTPPRLLLLREALRHELRVRGRILLVPEHAHQLRSLPRPLPLPLQDEGVTRRWIFGARRTSFPFLDVKVCKMTYLRTSSSFVRLNRDRILFARLGPRRLGTESSVSPVMAASPVLTTTRLRTAMSCPTMHPRIDLRLRSPARRWRCSTPCVLVLFSALWEGE